MEIARQNLLESLNKINEQIKECKSKKFNYVTGERYLTGWAIICKVQDNKELVDANEWGELVGMLNKSFGDK